MPNLHEAQLPTVRLHQGHGFVSKTVPQPTIAGLMAQVTIAQTNAKIVATVTKRKPHQRTPWVAQLLVQLTKLDGSRRPQSVF